MQPIRSEPVKSKPRNAILKKLLYFSRQARIAAIGSANHPCGQQPAPVHADERAVFQNGKADRGMQRLQLRDAAAVEGTAGKGAADEPDVFERAAEENAVVKGAALQHAAAADESLEGLALKAAAVHLSVRATCTPPSAKRTSNGSSGTRAALLTTRPSAVNTAA